MEVPEIVLRDILTRMRHLEQNVSLLMRSESFMNAQVQALQDAEARVEASLKAEQDRTTTTLNNLNAQIQALQNAANADDPDIKKVIDGLTGVASNLDQQLATVTDTINNLPPKTTDTTDTTSDTNATDNQATTDPNAVPDTVGRRESKADKARRSGQP